MIMGVFLITALVGGVYFLRQQTAQKPSNTSPVAQEKTDTKPEPSSEQPKAEQVAPVSESSNTTVRAQQAPATTKELPRTGMTETFGALIGAAALSGIGTAYVRSRRFTLAL
jgi:LPXTG-motif cell wall-anchored protein